MRREAREGFLKGQTTRKLSIIYASKQNLVCSAKLSDPQTIFEYLPKQVTEAKKAFSHSTASRESGLYSFGWGSLSQGYWELCLPGAGLRQMAAGFQDG